MNNNPVGGSGDCIATISGEKRVHACQAMRMQSSSRRDGPSQADKAAAGATQARRDEVSHTHAIAGLTH